MAAWLLVFTHPDARLFYCDLHLVQEKEMALVPSAYLIHENLVYHSTHPVHPVAELIEGIWTNHSQFARIITRSRIFTNTEPTPLCLGMIKVAAKRFTRLTPDIYIQNLNELLTKRKTLSIQSNNIFFPSPIQLPNHSISLEEAETLSEELSMQLKSKVGSILLDQENKIVSWGWNSHFKNRTLHAEVMAVKNYVFQYQKKIPTDHTLISTLQPCCMCAGYLHAHSENFSSIKIQYSKIDPGPLAQNSLLVEGSQLWRKYYL